MSIWDTLEDSLLGLTGKKRPASPRPLTAEDFIVRERQRVADAAGGIGSMISRGVEEFVNVAAAPSRLTNKLLGPGFFERARRESL